MSTLEEQIAQLEETIASLEAQRGVLGDAVLETAVAPLRQQLVELRRTTASSTSPALTGERKLVTVMFADVSGFTALAETMDPEAVRDLMNACFERLVPIVEKYKGTVDKFMGDGIMVLFGAPVVHENDPERALRTALEMAEALAGFNAENSTGLGLHFGINTGLVIAGGLGTRERQQYTVMGDAVNVASRLEAVSERGEILVGPDTYRLTAPLFEFETLEPVVVKGKAEPLPIYRLVAPKAVPEAVRGIAGLQSPLVGREVEFRVLSEAVERLQAGVGGIVTLVGEAGLGKSRLVAELRKQTLERVSEAASATPSVQWVEGRCLSFGTSIAYLLWLDVLRGLLGVMSEDSPTAVRDLLRERVGAWCPDQFEEVYPFLSWLMSLRPETEVEVAAHELDGEQLKTGVFRAIEILLEGAARQKPLLVVCEDLHWADPTSIDVLKSLLELPGRVPLLLLCVFRPEKAHGCWQVKEAAAQHDRLFHTDLRLAPLSAGDSQTLIRNLLYTEALPPELRDRILGSAEGNPFYVEEIIRSLMDGGAIAWDSDVGRWEAIRDVTEIAIPDTLQGVLVARIDRLQEETKRVLQLASVIGRVFFYRVLATIARDEQDLEEHILRLEHDEMIRERAREPELEYIFKHHLTQEAAYNGLLKKERQLFHRRVAQTLETLFPEQREEQIGLLAFHWDRAGDPKKATEYLLRAGDMARTAYAHQEAIDYYQRALEFLQEQEAHERAARTLMKLGLTYHDALNFRQAREAYAEGFVLWQQAGELRVMAPPSPAPHALRVAWFTPVTLDPTIANEDSSITVIDQLFGGLLERGPKMEVLPGVARSWEISQDGHRYVIHLRDDVRWSDGTPVTARDFEYAWMRALDPETSSPTASLLYDVKGARRFHQGEVSEPGSVGVRALDGTTLAVELERPTGYFLHLLTQWFTFPVPRHIVELYGSAWTELRNIVTNGPFNLESWEEGESAVLVRNPEYYGRFRGNVQRVELLFGADRSTRLAAYETGNLDIANLTGASSAEMDRARRRYAGEVVSVSDLATYYVGFDVGRPPFDDPRVRRAFVMATDRERLADVILGGYVFPATGGFVPPGVPAHSPGIALPYDPDRASRLLAEAGYPGGRDFPVVDLPGWHNAQAYNEYLQTQWRQNLGVDVTGETMEWAAYLDKMRKEQPQVFLMGWMADYPDPDSFLRVGIEWMKTVVNTQWRNAAYEELVEEARQVIDQAERLDLYQRADRILVEEAPMIPLVYSRAHLAVKPWVTRLPLAAITDWFWKDVIIEPH